MKTDSLPAETIEVVVEDDGLTVSGDDLWRFHRQEAANSVCPPVGITMVSIQIAIMPTLSGTGDMSDFKAALERLAAADAQAISVAVHRGDVTLVRNVVDKMHPVH